MAFNPDICPSNCTKLTHFNPVLRHIFAFKSTKIAYFKIMFFNQPFLQLNSDSGLPNSQSGALSGSNQNWLSTIRISYYRSRHWLTISSIYPEYGYFPALGSHLWPILTPLLGLQACVRSKIPEVFTLTGNRITLNSETIESLHTQSSSR